MTSTTGRPRIIRLAHASPGRLRVRLEGLREDRTAATSLADHLAGLDGVIDVAVRPRTGSVLCRYDEARLDAPRLVTAVRRHTGIATVLRADEPLPVSLRPPLHSSSSLGRAVADIFRGLDRDILYATGGRLDLGALAGLSLLAGGATEIAVTRQIPAPPWFSLAWWAFRTFSMFETSSPPAGAAEPQVRPPRPRQRSRRRVRG